MRQIEAQRCEIQELRNRAYEDKLRGRIGDARWVALEQRWAEKAQSLEDQAALLDAGEGPAVDKAEGISNS